MILIVVIAVLGVLLVAGSVLGVMMVMKVRGERGKTTRD